MKINLYIEIITHASYNIKRYYDVQGLCIKDIWKSEVDEMKKKARNRRATDKTLSDFG